MKVTPEELYREALGHFHDDEPSAIWLRVLTRLACTEACKKSYKSMWHAVAKMEELRDIEEQFWATEIYVEESKDGTRDTTEVIALY